MGRKILIVLLFMMNGSFALGAEPAEVIWWELEARARRSGAVSDTSEMSGAGRPAATSTYGEMQAAMGRPKTLLLRWGKFPSAEGHESVLSRSVTSNNAEGWIRSPNGTISSADVYPNSGSIALRCPSEKDSPQFKGIYIVGVHLDAGVMDLDADGLKERVHFYSNCFVFHRKRDALLGKNVALFFRDAEKMVLEIGPYIPKSRRGRCMGKVINQKAFQEHKMQVLYKGRPLANAEVTVLTESGWKKTVTTDSLGIMSITPLGNKLKSEQSRMSAEKYLYVVLHKEPLRGEYNGTRYASEYYCASVWTQVQMPRKSGKSRTKGFNFLIISGMGLVIIVVTLAIYRKKKLDKETMVKFDEYKIKKD